MNTDQFPTPAQVHQDRVFKEYDALLEQAANGATVTTSALFDLEGNWTPARIVESKYGYSWLVLDENHKSTGVYVPFKAKKRETQAKRGYVEGTVKVAAKAVMNGGFRPVAMLAPVVGDGTDTPIEIITTDRFKEQEKQG